MSERPLEIRLPANRLASPPSVRSCSRLVNTATSRPRRSPSFMISATRAISVDFVASSIRLATATSTPTTPCDSRRCESWLVDTVT